MQHPSYYSIKDKETYVPECKPTKHEILYWTKYFIKNFQM